MKMSSLTALPLVTRISNRVIRILGCNPGPMTLQGTNTYLVGTGERRILIDTGDKETASEYVKLLGDVLNSEKATLAHVLLTHWHHDHIGGVLAVNDLLSSKKSSEQDGLPRVWKLPRSPEDEPISEEERSVKWEPLEDGQSFEVLGATLTTKHTPGHTTDHACLKFEEENALFSGDCILGEGTAVFEDLSDYMASLSQILNTEPKIIYPGHGPVIEEPISRIRFYIEHREKRENEILEVLKKHASKENPISEIEIVKHVYQDTPEYLWPAASENVNHHLKKLKKDFRVDGETGGWFILNSN